MRPFALALLLGVALPVQALDFQLLDSIRLDDLEPLDVEGDLGMALAADDRWIIAGSQRQTRGFGQAYLFRIERDPLALVYLDVLRPPEFDPFIAVNATSRAGSFGEAIALSGDWMAVAAPTTKENPDGSGNTVGAVFVLRAGGSGSNPWQHAQRLVPTSISGQVVYSGYGVPLAMDGEYLAVGAPLADLFDGAARLDAAGAVDLWRRSGDSWALVQRLDAPSPEAGARFGYSLSLRADLLAVGEPLRDDDSETLETGRVHLFRLGPGGAGGFGFEQTLSAGSPAAEDRFGSAVALVPGGLMVGTRSGGEELGVTGDGSIHRFAETGSGWSEVGEQLGYDDHNVNPWGPGLVYDDGLLVSSEPSLFEGRVSVWRSDGSTLSLRDSLVDAPAGARGHYGLALALQRIGNLRVLAVGAPATETGTSLDAGRIDVLVYDEGLFSDGFED